jgi:1-deoxy-D-xylulose-5-phosphate reductoisomerase
MRLPILYALTYPERIQSDMRFAVSDLRHLDFSPPDLKKFPCLRLAYEAVEAGGAKTVALNAADEVAVAGFLEGKIRFDQIPRIIESVLAKTGSGVLDSIQSVLEADTEARETAREQVASIKTSDRPRATSFA